MISENKEVGEQGGTANATPLTSETLRAALQALKAWLERLPESSTFDSDAGENYQNLKKVIVVIKLVDAQNEIELKDQGFALRVDVNTPQKAEDKIIKTIERNTNDMLKACVYITGKIIQERSTKENREVLYYIRMIHKWVQKNEEEIARIYTVKGKDKFDILNHDLGSHLKQFEFGEVDIMVNTSSEVGARFSVGTKPDIVVATKDKDVSPER